MTTGIASQSAVDLAWIERALRSAHLDTFDTNDRRIRLESEVGRVMLTIDERRGLLRFWAIVWDETAVPSTTDPLALGTRLRELREAMTIARLAWYPRDEDPQLHAEYDLPILAGLSQGQFLALLRVFQADMTVAHR